MLPRLDFGGARRGFRSAAQSRHYVRREVTVVGAGFGVRESEVAVRVEHVVTPLCVQSSCSGHHFLPRRMRPDVPPRLRVAARLPEELGAVAGRVDSSGGRGRAFGDPVIQRGGYVGDRSGEVCAPVIARSVRGRPAPWHRTILSPPQRGSGGRSRDSGAVLPIYGRNPSVPSRFVEPSRLPATAG